jgi:hypothetical protein
MKLILYKQVRSHKIHNKKNDFQIMIPIIIKNQG